MLLWDGDLLTWNHLGSEHSLESWGVSHVRAASVSSHNIGGSLASDSLIGHWTLDAVIPVLSAASPADVSAAGGSDSAPAAAAVARYNDLSLAFVLPTVLKVEEPFAMPLVNDVSSFGDDIGSIGDYNGRPTVHAIHSIMGRSAPFILSIG